MTPAAKREAVVHFEDLRDERTSGVSGYPGGSQDDPVQTPAALDARLRLRLRDWLPRAAVGYRRLHVLLRGEGHVVNRKKTQRLYREEGLTVRKRMGRKRAAGSRAPIPIEVRPNARWSVDFVHDQLSDGRRFRILNVIDDVTKECLAAIADTSISGRRVARELDAIVAWRGRPDLIVSDHGTEFTSNEC